MNKTTILTDVQVRRLTRDIIRTAFTPSTVDQMQQLGVNFEDSIRLISLQAKCKEAREKLGLSIKEVAAKLKAPQYRIKAVEGGGPKQILPDVLGKYIGFLELEDWLQQWADANPKLAEKLGIAGFDEDSDS